MWYKKLQVKKTKFELENHRQNNNQDKDSLLQTAVLILRKRCLAYLLLFDASLKQTNTFVAQCSIDKGVKHQSWFKFRTFEFYLQSPTVCVFELFKVERYVINTTTVKGLRGFKAIPLWVLNLASLC